MAAIQGTGNSYPQGQCTYYADERYHELAGYYVPWSGNAKDWASLALGSGWTVSSTPIAPSIICLQPGIQGANSTYGHVGVVESVGNGTVAASNQNWGPTPQNVVTVDFTPGPGVSFIYAKDASGKAAGNTTLSFPQIVQNAANAVSLAPNSDMNQFLWWLDQVLLITNPFNVSGAQDTISIPGVNVSFTDPVAYTEGVLGNFFDDSVAFLIRIIFLIIGVAIILKVVSNFIDFGAIANTVQQGAQTAALAGAFV